MAVVVVTDHWLLAVVGVSTVSTQKQSGCELDCRGAAPSPALPPQAAASQNQVPVDFAIPACDWQDVDRQIRSLLAAGLSPAIIGRTLKLRQHYGISVRAIVRYARQLVAAGSLQGDGVVHRAGRPRALMPHSTQQPVDTVSQEENPMASSNAQPASSAAAVDARPSRHTLPVDHCRLDTLQAETFALLRRRLLDPDLTPEQLCKIGSAIAQQRTAFHRAQAQDNANRKAARDRRVLRVKDKEDAETRKQSKKSLEQRVWEIYGITMPWGYKKRAAELEAQLQAEAQGQRTGGQQVDSNTPDTG